MDDLDRWKADGERYGWVMPAAPWWKRTLIIRRIRAFWHAVQVDRHQSFFRSMGSLSSGYDEWVLYGIAMGMERAK